MLRPFPMTRCVVVVFGVDRVTTRRVHTFCSENIAQEWRKMGYGVEE